MVSDMQGVLWGSQLKNAIENVSSTREYLIEGLLYKKSTQMIYAPDGAGKSFISLQMCLQGTSTENMIYGIFPIEKPFKTCYIQAERPEEESLERMKAMMKATKFDTDNFVLVTALQGVNLRNEKQHERALATLYEIIPATIGTVDLIVIDPIYAVVRGGLKDDDACSYVTEFSRQLQAKFGCTVLLIHHANRGTRTETGERVGEDFFGSRFLRAHCTGVYKLSPNHDEGGCVMKLEKRSNGNLEASIALDYDHETGLSWGGERQGHGQKVDRVMTFLRNCRTSDRAFTFNEIVDKCEVSTAYLRKLISIHLKNRLEEVSKSSKGKILYKFSG